MAAIAYPTSPFGWERPDPRAARAAGRSHLRALDPRGEAPRVIEPRAAVIPLRVQPPARRLDRTRRALGRQLALWALPAALLAGTYFVAGAIAADPVHYSVLPGSTPAPGGYRYIVQPGDTLWSIATRLDPRGDPRVLVTSLAAQAGGSVVHPGESLLVP